MHKIYKKTTTLRIASFLTVLLNISFISFSLCIFPSHIHLPTFPNAIFNFLSSSCVRIPPKTSIFYFFTFFFFHFSFSFSLISHAVNIALLPPATPGSCQHNNLHPAVLFITEYWITARESRSLAVKDRIRMKRQPRLPTRGR